MNAWNQKNLDYEIETGMRGLRTIKPTTWNQKNLDYEIETRTIRHRRRVRLAEFLKSKEPRLRDWNDHILALNADVLETWNQKNLDYEIET